jgi:hypothetical protein
MPGIDIPVIIGTDDTTGIVAVAIDIDIGDDVDCGWLIIDEIFVLITGNPIKPVFVIISPLCKLSAT